jgi:hypothetical protein
MVEEFTHFRKSKPVILVAGVIWGLIGWIYAQHGLPHSAEMALKHKGFNKFHIYVRILI